LPSAATSLAAFAFGLLFGLRWGDDRLGAIEVTILMTQISISAMNEWADRERDAAAHRWRPVALGRIPAPVALGLAVAFALMAIPGALAFGLMSLALVVLGVGLGWTYDLVLKPTPFSFVPFAFAFPLLVVWVGIASNRPLSSPLLIFAAGAPLATAIHLADGLPDEAADATAGVRTLVAALGHRQAIRVMQSLLALGAVVIVVSSLDRPIIAVLLGLTAAAGATLAGKVAASHPAQARWVVAGIALLMVVAWMVRLHG